MDTSSARTLCGVADRITWPFARFKDERIETRGQFFNGGFRRGHQPGFTRKCTETAKQSPWTRSQSVGLGISFRANCAERDYCSRLVEISNRLEIEPVFIYGFACRLRIDEMCEGIRQTEARRGRRAPHTRSEEPNWDILYNLGRNSDCAVGCELGSPVQKCKQFQQSVTEIVIRRGLTACMLKRARLQLRSPRRASYSQIDAIRVKRLQHPEDLCHL